MNTNTTRILSLCLFAGLAASSLDAGPRVEAVPPWLKLEGLSKKAAISGELSVQLEAPAGAAPSTPPSPHGLLLPGGGGMAPPATPPDLQFRTSTGALVVLQGSHRLGLPADLFEAAPISKSGGTAPAKTSMLLRYEQEARPDGSRYEFVLLPQKGDALYFAHIDRGGDKAVSREILPGFTIQQQDDPAAVPAVEGNSSRRFWIPATIATSDGKWTLKGGDQAVVTHKGKCYSVLVHRSLRREPGAGTRFSFEGEKFLLSLQVVQIKDCSQAPVKAK